MQRVVRRSKRAWIEVSARGWPRLPRRAVWMVAAWCLMLGISSATAAEPPAQEGTTGGGASSPLPENPSSNPSYLLVPGDVLDVTVSTHRGLDRTITIQPDGRIQFPRAGEIVAAGLTASQLAARIREKLGVELVDPHVTVGLKELNRGLMRRVSVLGAVKSPGAFELKEGSTLAEILATAGGPTPVADLRRVAITRVGGARTVVDLADATRTGNAKNNTKLLPGDLVLVPEGVAPTVLVLGQVAKPGSYERIGEMRVLDALSLAGGPTPRADLSRLTLTRAGTRASQVLDLQVLLTKGQQPDLSANVLLQPGDTLVVPESERKYYVIGEVTKSDAYPLKEGDRLLDAITTAGGSSREGDLGKVMLIRRNAAGQPEARKIDLKKMMRNGRLLVTENEPLKEGDVIYIPDRKQRRNVPEILSAIYPLSGLVNLLRLR